MLMKTLKLAVAACCLMTVMGWSTAVLAQQATDSESGWKSSFVIYLLAPTIEGKVGIGPIDGDIDIDPSTVFDTLDGAFLATYAVEKGNWGALFDLIYMDLSEDVTGNRIPLTGEIGMKQLIFGANAAYRLNDRLQVLFGGRYVDLSTKFSLNLPDPARFKLDQSWFDPTIGLRFAGSINDRWSYGALGDIGGFGVGSDLTWQLTGSFSYRMTNRSLFTFGYRYIDFDYEDGKGRDAFKFDVAEHGPALGFRFDF